MNIKRRNGRRKSWKKLIVIKTNSNDKIINKDKSVLGHIMKNILVFTPIVLSALLLAAHFKKAGLVPLVIFALLMPVILFYKRAWVARLVQIVFVLGAIEWIRTTLSCNYFRSSCGFYLLFRHAFLLVLFT